MDQESSQCPFVAESIIQKCPFLRNINKPTNLSFSSLSLPIPVIISYLPLKKVNFYAIPVKFIFPCVGGARR